MVVWLFYCSNGNHDYLVVKPVKKLFYGYWLWWVEKGVMERLSAKKVSSALLSQVESLETGQDKKGVVFSIHVSAAITRTRHLSLLGLS